MAATSRVKKWLLGRERKKEQPAVYKRRIDQFNMCWATAENRRENYM